MKGMVQMRGGKEGMEGMVQIREEEGGDERYGLDERREGGYGLDKRGGWRVWKAYFSLA